jgi:hypothetical protein
MPQRISAGSGDAKPKAQNSGEQEPKRAKKTLKVAHRTRFLNANRSHLRIKSEGMFRWKTL